MEGYILGVFILTIVATIFVVGIRLYGRFKGNHSSHPHQSELVGSGWRKLE